MRVASAPRADAHARCPRPWLLCALASRAQVPQYVLEEAAELGRPCSVIVTQPRRISALGVSERVAAERGEAVGGVVGYSIRLESKSSAATALLFCTTGILTRRLEEDSELEGVTHLFVDEVHWQGRPRAVPGCRRAPRAVHHPHAAALGAPHRCTSARWSPISCSW